MAPNHSFLFDHLLYLKTFLYRLPKDAHYTYSFVDIYRDQFQKEGVFYLDLWPISGAIMVAFSSSVAMATLVTKYSLAISRPDILHWFFKPIGGGVNVFDMAEPEWRP